MNEAQILDFVKSCGHVLLSSVDEQGFPHTRAMLAPRKNDGLQHFWHSTNTSSSKVTQLRKNPKACLYFFDPQQFIGVEIIGTMTVLEDQASKDLIWRTGDELFYPLGKTDPDYCVLKFTGQVVRVYANFTSQSIVLQQNI